MERDKRLRERRKERFVTPPRSSRFFPLSTSLNLDLSLLFSLLFSPEIIKQVKRAMTMTEKILSNHIDSDASSSTSSAARSVRPGDNVWTKVDKLMTHDVCGPGTFGIFQKEFGEAARVWDPEAVIIIPVSSLLLGFILEEGNRLGGGTRKKKKKKGSLLTRKTK